MAKKPILNEADVLARMAGGFQERPAKIAETITGIPEEPKKEEKEVDDERQSFIVKETRGSGNGKRNVYEEKFLSRSIYGVNRSNVGISRETLDIAEKVIARIFDNKIAVSTYIDNVLRDHFNRYRKEYEVWLVERPSTIF